MLVIDDNVDTFSKQTLVAVLGTTNESGLIHLVPIWFNWDHGEAYMFTHRESPKWRNLRLNPYASLCVDRREPPYSSVILYGYVQEVQLPIYDLVYSMAVRYYGDRAGRNFAEGYKDNPTGGVAFKLTPERVVQRLNS